MDDHVRLKRLDVMEQVVTCRECELAEKCSGPVAFTGETPAKIAIMGESPGKLEDESSLLFVGPAGEVLRDAIEPYASILEPYVMLNVVSCYPGGPPTKAHIDACAPNRTAQLRVGSPKFVLLLGRTATQTMAPTLTEFAHARRHPFQMDGVVYVPAHHPTAALQTDGLKEEFLGDIDFFVEVVASGDDWIPCIPDTCSACTVDAIWWANSGLGWCEVHLPPREREKFDGWIARGDELAAERLAGPQPGPQTARADAEAATEARTASEAFRAAAELSDPEENDVQLRSGARDTEKAAASAAFPKSGTQRGSVLRLIFESEAWGGEIGCTDQEIEQSLSIRPSSASTRRAELEKGGWIEDSGLRRKTPAGNEAIVWRVTDAAKAKLS